MTLKLLMSSSVMLKTLVEFDGGIHLLGCVFLACVRCHSASVRSISSWEAVNTLRTALSKRSDSAFPDSETFAYPEFWSLTHLDLARSHRIDILIFRLAISYY